ncbi:hypothetical protein PF001_g33102 [Phytophthora fragariae]|uniref:RxLR effector protein n=1 Tax=Phytophthora fragariae TaxID=53985 RepID=A0A6A4AMV5_9STRA|nr:hypothetical protein PF001_g33102 [Phytophthora fragariae]
MHIHTGRSDPSPSTVKILASLTVLVATLGPWVNAKEGKEAAVCTDTTSDVNQSCSLQGTS